VKTVLGPGVHQKVCNAWIDGQLFGAEERGSSESTVQAESATHLTSCLCHLQPHVMSKANLACNWS
jgi:hypothetical protein